MAAYPSDRLAFVARGIGFETVAGLLAARGGNDCPYLGGEKTVGEPRQDEMGRHGEPGLDADFVL